MKLHQSIVLTLCNWSPSVSPLCQPPLHHSLGSPRPSPSGSPSVKFPSPTASPKSPGSLTSPSSPKLSRGNRDVIFPAEHRGASHNLDAVCRAARGLQHAWTIPTESVCRHAANCGLYELALRLRNPHCAVLSILYLVEDAEQRGDSRPAVLWPEAVRQKSIPPRS